MLKVHNFEKIPFWSPDFAKIGTIVPDSDMCHKNGIGTMKWALIVSKKFKLGATSGT